MPLNKEPKPNLKMEGLGECISCAVVRKAKCRIQALTLSTCKYFICAGDLHCHIDWLYECNIMAEGFRFMPLGLVRLRTFRLSTWVS